MVCVSSLMRDLVTGLSFLVVLFSDLYAILLSTAISMVLLCVVWLVPI